MPKIGLPPIKNMQEALPVKPTGVPKPKARLPREKRDEEPTIVRPSEDCVPVSTEGSVSKGPGWKVAESTAQLVPGFVHATSQARIESTLPSEMDTDVCVIEHLKAYTSHVLGAFHAGSGLEGAPITLDIAQQLLWREIQRTIRPRAAGEPYVHLRIAAAKREAILACLAECGMEVVSVRCLGPRAEGHEHVAYCVVRGGFDSVPAVFKAAAGQRCTVRDWEFYTT